MLASAWLASAFAGILFDVRDGAGEKERIQLTWTALGALCGAAAELWVRGWRPSRRIGIWGLLELTAFVAIVVATFALIRDA